MTIENDETLQIYLEESLEHLADIENDFLEIERAGADIDEELVNKVYRAAHSIKGGAGFMGLTIIKDLTHEMENILGKIRSRTLIPNPEIVNILLMASDALKELMEDVFNSNDSDISEHITALQSIAESTETEAEKPTSNISAPQQEAKCDPQPPASQEISGSDPDCLGIAFPDARYVLHPKMEDMNSERDDGKHIYLIEIDLVSDVQEKEKTPLEFVEEMQSCGNILDSMVDVDAAGTLETEQLEKFPFAIVFASILKPNDINKLFEIDERGIFEIKENLEVVPIVEPGPPEASIIDAVELEAVLSNETAHPEPFTQDLPKSETIESKPEPADDVSQDFDPVEENEQAKSNKQNNVETIAASSPDPPLKTQEKDQAKDSQQISGTTETSLRVHVSLLDSLMNLAGELVLSRNQLLQSIGSADQRASELAGQRIDLITSELQEAIMITRMQAIGNVFNKFPRVVRDLARKLGKDVELTLEGKEVEMDKTIIEAINDPLTHLVRNSVDHGIEKPDERQKAGKDPKGHVKLKAYHEAGQVNVEIVDDGKGLDGRALANAAVAKGLISEEQVSTMSDKEKVSLIFLPGFSTAEKVTDVSGRGVGMDVVKTNLDKLGGVVDIDSEVGVGTSIRIKLPLTLAIIPSQIIATGKERYAIPQVNLEELLRISASQVKNRIERVGEAEVVRLRGNLLPLVNLADVIGIEKTYFDANTKTDQPDRRELISDRRGRKSELFNRDSDDEERTEESILLSEEDKRSDNPDRRYHATSALNIVVVSTGTMKYGLVVDELLDSEEIVVKPLGRHLKQCNGYAGATIMGDGRVALILDVGNLAQMAQLSSVSGTDRAAEVSKEAKDETGIQDKQSLLVFRSSEKEQFVVPLNQVERIEKIKRTQIEEIGNKKVLQYRGGSLPLFSIDQVAQVKPMDEKEELLVVVFNIAGRGVGLMAMGPVDVMQLFVEFDDSTVKQPGILGSAIIGDHTTLLVDIYDIVRTLNPDWFGSEDTVQKEEGETSATVLVVEDSNFFRKQVRSYIEEEGCQVIEAEDGMIGWNLLQEHEDEITLVCTDIEMPNLDGFGLTEKIRAQNKYSSLPVIALTTLAADEDVARGKQVGIDDYQIKLDKEKLLECIRHCIKNGRPNI